MSTILRPTADSTSTMFAEDGDILIVLVALHHADGGRTWDAYATVTHSHGKVTTIFAGWLTADGPLAAVNGRFGTAFTLPAGYRPASPRYTLRTDLTDTDTAEVVRTTIKGDYPTLPDALVELETIRAQVIGTDGYYSPRVGYCLEYTVGRYTVRVTVDAL